MLEMMMRSNAEVAVLGIVLFADGLHLREIARRAGVSAPEAKRELDILSKTGLLHKEKKGSMSIYSLDAKCPFISELRGLYLKTEGTIPLLKKELGKLANLRYAFVYGSFASGNFSGKSDIDLFLEGDVDAEAAGKACFEVQNATLREINYILWSDADLKKKLKEGGSFVSSLLKKEKIWLAGDADEFADKAKRPAAR